jgi:asparagine synthase (glutamine-hydrolysing)
MELSYLGGILKRSAAERRRAAGQPAGAADEDWGWVADDAELFAHAPAAGGRLFTWDSLALLVRGHARPRAAGGPPDVERVAEEVRCHYLEHGTLDVDGLEGSFTLALLDGHTRRVLLYRNLVGAGFTYYHSGPDGLLFGSNLAQLVDAAGAPLRPNRHALPAFFLYRFVPGHETLFDGFLRLMPGEQVSWEAGRLTRVQRHTFADLRGPRTVGADAVERLDETMGRVLADCAALRPGTANLLSGGVDSSYLQAVWDRVAPLEDALPPSFSVSVDHPGTWPDTDYAVTASQALGTRHTLVPADGPYAGYLLDTLATAAEPPNHVQTAYFGHLARVMAGLGVTSGLCGEGADSLFGLTLANQVQNAAVLRRLVPGRLPRKCGARVSGLLGFDRLAATFRLAGVLDDLTDLEHPVNRVASFTDRAAVEACFGRAAVREAAAGRRALLERYQVGPSAQDRLHATGYLGEAMDSASLWTTLFNQAGADLFCPFLDSRVLRLVLNLAPEVRYPFRRPKDLLKRALAGQAPEGLARRTKLGFGQPIFEWLGPGGQLRPLVERLGAYDFVDARALGQARARPNWFLYSLLCYDLWHKLFIDRSLPRPAALTPEWRDAVPTLAALR